MRMKPVFFVFLFSLLFSSCKEDQKSTDTPFFGYQYSPISVGQYRVYQVDSIAYDDFNGTIDTIRFQEKTEVESIETSQAVGSSYVLGVYRRDTSTDPWKKTHLIRQVLGSRTYEIQDNNVVYLALTFPINNATTWDSNAKNVFPEKRYRLENLHQSAVIAGINYDSTIRVNQLDEFNEIERFLEEEIYAARVGLVYQRKLAVQTEFGGEIRSGYDRSMELIEFGLE